MNQRISAFIDGQSVATICCVDDENNPYCFNCFYAYDADRQLLYFKSARETLHVKMLLKNPMVSGTVLPDKLNRLAVAGIQYYGRLTMADDKLSSGAMRAYHYKYPFASVMHGEIWIIQLNRIKMTDSTLGFGKKIVWERDEVESV